MSNENISRLRVLHLVSAVGAPGALQQLLFMPLLTRIPKERVQAQVVCLSPGAVPAAVLRQNGVPVHEVALSRKRFSMGGLAEVLSEARRFHPDVIQAWGHTAQIVSTRVRARCAWRPKLVWAVAETTPLARDAGFLDRQKLKFAARLAAKTDCIVYTSEAGAGQHRRVGFPEEGHRTIPPGVDAARFKPDPAVRRKVREQLKLAPNAFVIGMAAPFQPEFDHATLIKAAAELSKTHRETALVLAGYGVQPGNAALMALIGGALSSHTHLLGEWSDVGSLFNACDVVCSSALTDRSRMTLVMAMLCGVPCVATGMGAQGEVLGRFGVAVETGSPAAFVRGITRIMQLTPERRAQMIHGARTHAMNDYVYVQSLQKYLQLYSDLIGREPAGASDPEPTDSALPQAPAPPSGNKLDTLAVEPPAAALASPATQPDVPPSDSAPVLQRDAVQERPLIAPSPKAAAAVARSADPDRLETTVAERPREPLPKRRIEQEEEIVALEPAKPAAASCDGDVLELFESSLSAAEMHPVPEAAAPEEDMAELLAPDMLKTEAVVQKPTALQPMKPRHTPQESPTARLDAAARMRAAAREELKRAAAAMSAPLMRPHPPHKSPDERSLQELGGDELLNSG